jgi:hypothetical protein
LSGDIWYQGGNTLIGLKEVFFTYDLQSSRSIKIKFFLHHQLLHRPCFGLIGEPLLDLRPNLVKKRTISIGFQVFGGIPVAVGKEDVFIQSIIEKIDSMAAWIRADLVFEFGY